jgi:phosphatidate cytidylyltransferase
MLMTRVATAAIALALFAGALFFLPQGGWALFLLVVLGLSAWEWAALARYSRAASIAYTALLVLCAAALFYLTPLMTAAPASIDTAVFGLSCVFWIGVAPFWLGRLWRTRNPALLAVAGWIALVPMWLALVRLQPTPWALLLVMSVVWIADTAAYAAGKSFGRHKLAPQISPGKTWEGAFGAMLAVAVYYGALLLVLAPGQRYFDGLGGLGVFILILVLSIEGDLFESWLKRQAGVKDSGQLLPGHGGILDRIDGLTATMPLAALALHLR